jgi:hypothetical protein
MDEGWLHFESYDDVDVMRKSKEGCVYILPYIRGIINDPS